MDEEEIKSSLTVYPHFGGVYARDELPYKVTGPIGIIVNTDVRANPGAHWVGIYIDGNSKGELFDSLASQEVLDSFKGWMERNTISFLFPQRPIQSSISKLCGVYCIAFLGLRFEDWSFIDVINSFVTNPLKNDLFMYNLVKDIKDDAF